VDETKVRQRLAARRHDLEKLRTTAEPGSGNGPEPSDELSHYDQHPADAASETYEREQAFSVVEMAEAGLRDVDMAAHRLDEGKYGICEVCGKPIDEARLEARPEARYCVEHAPK
jgi:RNA polymerase-binding transcription factor DksA